LAAVAAQVALAAPTRHAATAAGAAACPSHDPGTATSQRPGADTALVPD
jgi:hypothetical protein